MRESELLLKARLLGSEIGLALIGGRDNDDMALAPARQLTWPRGQATRSPDREATRL